MKRVFAVIVCLFSLIALCSCGGSYPSVDGTQWQLTGMELGGIELSGADSLAAYGLSGSIEFEDGSFTLTLPGSEQTGTYTQKQDILTLKGGTTMFGVVKADSLTIEDDDIGILYFEKK